MRQRFLTAFSLFVILVWGAACSSKKSSGVLEEVPKDSGEQDISEENPNLTKLGTLLDGLGYKGVGLQYEEVGTIDLLHQVFSDERTHNRKIQLIYTGLQMDYDERYESLTVGGDNLESILSFIQKKVKKK